MKLFDIVRGSKNDLTFHSRPVSQQLVLELLNHAVWAPNHGLREPWRFIFVDNESGNKMPEVHDRAPAHLIVVVKEESDAHKRDEDFAATCCLMQNFQLLAWEKMLGVRITMNEWIYDRQSCGSFGIQEKERIAAVLDLGYVDSNAAALSAARRARTEVSISLL
ncbi:nitroreductase family protein [Paenibacillus eucommiae]|uniref:Nitroreductase n=1 Tax=Paenibacillus eucommiae TaxID=1355755 RepID=A0ABS4IRH6_9BACL|nr:nitroreductase family protein [Paenibacillus eucommiae]MBP1990174.1 nitroreductase [Paenibacillus eucommiae]